MFIIKNFSWRLKNWLKNQKLSKTFDQTELENTMNESSYEEIIENIQNEAIEAKLAFLIASTPASRPSTMSVTISSGTSLTFYSGCQTAGPQVD